MLPLGPTCNPAGLLVLGSGPSRDEVKAGDPLESLTGREMRAVLQEAGINSEKLLVANAYACSPIEPRRDTEERRAVQACRPLLKHYTDKLPPETPTLLAGKWAMLALTGKEKGLFATRGFVDADWSLSTKLAAEEAPEVEE